MACKGDVRRTCQPIDQGGCTTSPCNAEDGRCRGEECQRDHRDEVEPRDMEGSDADLAIVRRRFRGRQAELVAEPRECNLPGRFAVGECP